MSNPKHLVIVSDRIKIPEDELLEIVRAFISANELQETLDPEEALKDSELRAIAEAQWMKTTGAARIRENEQREAMENLKTAMRESTFGPKLSNPIGVLTRALQNGKSAEIIVAEDSAAGVTDIRKEIGQKFGVVLPDALYGSASHANAARRWFISTIKWVQDLQESKKHPEDVLAARRARVQRHIEAVNYLLISVHGFKDPRSAPPASNKVFAEVSELLDRTFTHDSPKEDVSSDMQTEREAKEQGERAKREKLAEDIFYLYREKNPHVDEDTLRDIADRLAKRMIRDGLETLDPLVPKMLSSRISEVVNLKEPPERLRAITEAMIHASFLGKLDGYVLAEVARLGDEKRMQAEEQRKNAFSSNSVGIATPKSRKQEQREREATRAKKGNKRDKDKKGSDKRR